MGARVVLASASPRRRELLARAGVEFEVDVPEVDESIEAHCAPEDAACILAERKARAVAGRRGADHISAGDIGAGDIGAGDIGAGDVGAGNIGAGHIVVLAADTIVALGSGDATRLLGKPADPHEARAMLRALSGTRHRVITGVCALVPGREPVTDYERTWVTMRAIEPAEIEAYIESGEWRDKAGGYAIQENADAFVTRLDEGGFDNVVGLPVDLALRLIARAAALAGEGRGS